MTISLRTAAAASAVAALALGTGRPSAQQPQAPPAGEWRSYAGDLRNHHYSPLDQINAGNFTTLEVAWRFKTDSLGPRPEYKLEGTPLVVGGMLYTTAGTRRAVVALDARDRRAALGALGDRRRARRQLAAPAVGPRRGLLDRRPRRRADSLRHDRLSAGRARREDRRRASPSFGKDGIVDLKEGVVVGKGEQIDLDDRRDRPARHARDHARRRRADRLVVPRRRHAEDAQQHEGARARVRRADRQAAVDVQHDSAPGRVRQRHLAERIVGGQRQRRRLEPDGGRRGARARLPAGRDAQLGLLRRPAPGQQPVRREHRRDRLQDRPAQVALPARAPSDLEHGHRRGADARRHHGRRAGR